MSSKIGSKQETSPPLSSSPTYSLSEESQYINASNAINNRSSRSISTNFDSNGPVSPSESSSSSGSQASSISSASKRPMSMEEKRLRQYSESSLIPNANISSTRGMIFEHLSLITEHCWLRRFCCRIYVANPILLLLQLATNLMVMFTFGLDQSAFKHHEIVSIAGNPICRWRII